MVDQPAAELPTVSEAFARAVSIAEGEDSPEVTPDLDGKEAAETEETEAPTEDAEPAEEEQPEATEADPEEVEEDIFADLDDTDGDPDEGETFDLMAAEVEIDGLDAPLPVKELRDGYLRQADYTRKTQALAEERKTFDTESDAAKRLYEALASDPAGTAAYLAEQTGLVEQGALGEKTAALQGTWQAPLTGDALDKEIETRVAQRLAEHPSVVEAEQQNALARIDRDFADIETKNKVTLPPKTRERILKRAIDAETSNLDLVYTAMQAELDQQRRQREDAKATATTRPGPREDTDSDKPAKISSVRDALDAAIAEAEAAA